jgi:hypothetical protein
VDVQTHIFLTWAPTGGEWPDSRSGRFIPGEKDPGPDWIAVCVNPRADLDDGEENSGPYRDSNYIYGLRFVALSTLKLVVSGNEQHKIQDVSVHLKLGSPSLRDMIARVWFLI